MNFILLFICWGLVGMFAGAYLMVIANICGSVNPRRPNQDST